MAAPDIENEMPMPVVEGVGDKAADPMPRLCFTPDPGEEDDMRAVVSAADEEVRSRFAGVFAVEQRLLGLVRAASCPNAPGGYIESWDRLTDADLEWFIQAGSAEAFTASQVAIDAYAEATISKYSYDDAYDAAYMRQADGTIQDKSSQGRALTRDRRWSALYRAIVYRKAKEALDRLDSHVRRAETIYRARGFGSQSVGRASR